MKARKRFGQNFLQDKNLIARIVDAINIKPGDHIVEIGPGHGALTELLAKSGASLEVIEIDRDLIAELSTNFPGLTIHDSDVLKFDFSNLNGKSGLRIVGNLPYNISTPLLFRLFELGDRVQDMHFMLQAEVVDRLIAGPSTPDYGRLSVMSQYYCQSEKLIHVPPEAFIPRPKVQSAVVRLTPHSQFHTDHEETLSAIVLAAFNMRRKTIRNSMKPFISGEQLEAIGIDPGLRPENLALSDYLNIANAVSGTAA